MSEINYQALRKAAAAIQTVATARRLAAFRAKATPQVVLALLNELEAEKSKLNEQREYYEGVIADGSKRIAKMEAIKSAAEKLVRCKGRYHSEQNYRALAALFGITVPDLPPLEVEPALYMNRFTRKTFSLEEQPGADKEPEIYMPLYAAPPAPVVPEKLPREYRNGWPLAYSDYAEGWNDCREAMLQSGNFRENTNSSTNNFRKIPETSTNPPVTQALLLGGFTIEDAKELHEDLVRSHISKALSGENMKKKDRDADLRWIHGVIVQAAWFVKATLEQNALSGNSPVTPDSWISCSERMPAQDDWILIYSKHGEYMAGQVQGEYVELSDGTLSWLGNALFWMQLPEPPQEVNQ